MTNKDEGIEVDELEEQLRRQWEKATGAGANGAVPDLLDEQVGRVLRGDSLGWFGKRLADGLILADRLERVAQAALRASWRVVKPALHAAARSVAQLTAPPESEVAWRDWQVDFAYEGKKGEVKEIVVDPQLLSFQGQKMMATDSSADPGGATRVGYILVGQRPQRPVGQGRTLTKFYASDALCNGAEWQPCRLGEKIRMEVEFLEDCQFYAVVFGKRRVERGEKA